MAIAGSTSSDPSVQFAGADAGRTGARALWRRLQRPLLARYAPDALALYRRVVEDNPWHDLIEVLPRQRLVYVVVPKAACSRIRSTLSQIVGANIVDPANAHRRELSGLKAPRQLGVLALKRVITDPHALRFSFVRNPYARLVSHWASAFQFTPLVPGQKGKVDHYLAYREKFDPALPAGPDRQLTFAEFAALAVRTAHGVNGHWNVQAELVEAPGIRLDLVGRVERFAQDMRLVLDHCHAAPHIRAGLDQRISASRHASVADYYDQRLADLVYRAYERDFDTFGYTRALPT